MNNHQKRDVVDSGIYDIHPAYPLGDGRIWRGFDALAETLGQQTRVVIDGYGGVLWEALRSGLDRALMARGLRVAWACVDEALLPEGSIVEKIAPFLGGDDPLFGTRFSGSLADFFDPSRLIELAHSATGDLSILYGAGAALAARAAGWEARLVYVDVPKHEIQLRSRAGKITNLGVRQAEAPKKMYKRFYFIDWPALNRHKAELLPAIDIYIDAQDAEMPVGVAGGDLRDGLSRMSQTFFRVLPWFEPGPWGGQWMKAHIPGLDRSAPNYAWSFELIVPENGLVFESDGAQLECSFDLLMFQEYKRVLGERASRFGFDFPIRFDFLDTFDGGNLSLQCHPRPEYTREHFGENFTQDETYYMLDCKPGAQVYLGFRDDIDPDAFRAALETSYAGAVPVEVERFVNIEPAHKHDLFLIPNGTIHCSGANCMVLEISSTPYIFTFKMYDWLRLDLDGRPRPLNIARAFENLYFDRTGERIRREFVSHPRLLRQAEGWQLYHLPTHPEHFYDVQRLAFTGRVELETNGSCQVMSLVEGQSILLETRGGMRQRFNYAETFVVPAAAERFTLVNEQDEPALVVMAFLK